jgi:hypothetical protein
VNEAGGDVESEETQQPQDQQYQCDDSKHSFLLGAKLLWR